MNSLTFRKSATFGSKNYLKIFVMAKIRVQMRQKTTIADVLLVPNVHLFFEV